MLSPIELKLYFDSLIDIYLGSHAAIMLLGANICFASSGTVRDLYPRPALDVKGAKPGMKK